MAINRYLASGLLAALAAVSSGAALSANEFMRDSKVTNGIGRLAQVTSPSGATGAGDPPRPILRGSVPNPQAPGGSKRAPATGRPPASGQARESDLEFLRQPVRRESESEREASTLRESEPRRSR